VEPRAGNPDYAGANLGHPSISANVALKQRT
jgi:hypothetical protein